MGHLPEGTARTYGFSRAEQDAFAAESVRRALAACESGAFGAELVAVTVKSRKGEQVVDRDEAPYGCDIDNIPQLKPAFDKDGTVPAASSSSIADGAAAVVRMRESAMRAAGVSPLARGVLYASPAHEPEWFTTAPSGAIQRVL